ncbi:MAG: hypothetical protein ACLFSY_02215 [Desulfonatronovibrionaceae bacterium]
MQQWDEVIRDLQSGLGRGYLQDNAILNTPGRSIACKLDPHYYLAPIPLFLRRLAYLSAKPPDKVRAGLINTGNLVTRSRSQEHSLTLAVTWPGLTNPMPIQACFILAEFIDRALRIYARIYEPLPVAELQIVSGDKAKVEKFFADKTAPHDLAFA